MNERLWTLPHPYATFWARKQFSKRKFYSTRQELIEFIIIKKLAILRLSRKPAGAQTVNLFRELEKIESSCSLREDIWVCTSFSCTLQSMKGEKRNLFCFQISLWLLWSKWLLHHCGSQIAPYGRFRIKGGFDVLFLNRKEHKKQLTDIFPISCPPFDLRLLSSGIKNSQFACGGEQHLVCKATLPRRNFALKKYQIWTAKGHQIPKYSFPIDGYIFFCRCPASVLSAASKWRFSCDPTSFSFQSGLQIWISGVYGRTHCWKFKLWLSFPCGWWWYNQSYKTA